MQIYIPAGVTSNLFTAIIHLFYQDTVYATVRPSTDPNRIRHLAEAGVKFITLEQALEMQFDRVLWLSTHDDTELLAKFSANTPTLAIASGAIMDFFRGIQSEESLNAYQASKLAICRTPGIYVFIPGFYIEDIGTPDWASPGLHGETTSKLFSKAFYSSPDFDWGKAYSVTPKSFMILAIYSWLKRPLLMPQNQPIIVCSDRQYRRHELRRAVPNLSMESVEGQTKGLQTAALPDLIYSAFPHIHKDGQDLIVTHDMVVSACKIAAANTQ